MYCINCGKQIGDNDTFCPSCGKNQSVNIQPIVNPNATIMEDDKRRTWAFFISIFTIPLLYIIRKLEETTEHVQAGQGTAWASYDYSAVPENIQSVMIVLLIISTCLNVGLRIKNKTPGRNKGFIATIMLFINIIFGLVIIYGKSKL